MKYVDELTKAMDFLAKDSRTIFIGQAVEYPGTSMTDTLKNVPKNKLYELPVAEEMACRYAGPDGAEQLAPSHDWERYLVRLVPREGRLTTWQGAAWAARYFDPGQRPDLEAKDS